MKIGVSIPLQNLLELIQLKTTSLAQVVTPARYIRALFKIVVYLGTMRLFFQLVFIEARSTFTTNETLCEI